MKAVKKKIKVKENISSTELSREKQECNQTLTGWDIIKENISPFLQVSAVLSALFTGILCIFFAFMNYVKSFLYSVDYSLFKIDFNLYNALLIYIILIGCAFCVMALWNTIRFLKNKILKKKVGEVSKISFAISFILLLICIRCYKYGVMVLFSFLVTMIGTGILVIGMVKFAKLTDKNEEDNSDKPFSKQLLDLGFEMTLMVLIEFILIFISIYCSIISKNEYYILQFNDSYEVVIETYDDYYITKKAYIEDEKLYILRDSQNARDTKNNGINKKYFSSISFQ